MKIRSLRFLVPAKVYDFAPTIVTALVALAILGYAHFSASAIGQGKHTHDIDLSKGVTSISAVDKGNYVVQFADDRLVKFEPGGRPLWEIPFDRLKEFPPVVVVSVAVEPLGDVLALGITPDTKMMIVYRVSGSGRQPTVSLEGKYPGLEPSRVAVAPDGTVYLTAYHRETLLRSIADIGQLPQEYVEQPIHELDAQGRIARSLGSMRHKPKSVQDLGNFLFLCVNRRLVFAPGGNAYLLDAEAFELEQVDLDSGELTGKRVRLASGAPSQHAKLDGLVFLDDTSVLYTVARLEQASIDRLGRIVVATPVGWEVRIADLEEGSSLRVTSGQSPLTVTALFFADSDTVTLVRNLETFAGHTEHKWPRFDLLELLARQH